MDSIQVIVITLSIATLLIGYVGTANVLSRKPKSKGKK